MGITFLRFTTPLARERYKEFTRLMRTTAETEVRGRQKWQYYRGGVAKMSKDGNILQHVQTMQFQNVFKTIGGSMVFEDTTLQKQKTTVAGPLLSSNQSKKIKK